MHIEYTYAYILYEYIKKSDETNMLMYIYTNNNKFLYNVGKFNLTYVKECGYTRFLFII